MGLPIHIETKFIRSPKVKVSYPIVTKLPLPHIERKINNEIISNLNNMLIEEGFYNKNLMEMIGHY
ncbi:hypothetical protein WAX74_11260 [Psychrobacillus sp. FJAT-51614]|uniref:Uncharacterized protein n=1 Tax=Psychrobacillus mangrovi TaxID=3117745 RepID=A0ABU8F5B9_9BACI